MSTNAVVVVMNLCLLREAGRGGYLVPCNLYELKYVFLQG